MPIIHLFVRLLGKKIKNALAQEPNTHTNTEHSISLVFVIQVGSK